MSRLLRALVATIVAAYLLVIVALWYSQASFIFQPDAVVGHTPADSGVPFEKVSLPVGAGQVAGWWVPSQQAQAATLLYSHGNASNVGANAGDVVHFHQAGLNVFIYDYRGYGESTGGPPREKKAYEDAERAWMYLVAERHTPPASIAIYGHSLGSAVAVDLASRHPDAGALVLEGALTSIAGVADTMWPSQFIPVRLILTERFDALSKIGSVRIPLLMLEGENDHTIMARQLYDAAREPKRLTLIPGAGHEDSAEVNPSLYFGALTTFLQEHDVARP